MNESPPKKPRRPPLRGEALTAAALKVAAAAPAPGPHGLASPVYDALEPAVRQLVARGYRTKAACELLRERGVWAPQPTARSAEAKERAFGSFYRSMCRRLSLRPGQ